MKSISNIIAIIIVIVCFPHFVKAQSPDWELKKDREGIRVYTLAVEDSDLDEFRGVAYVDASVEEIVALLKDVESMTDWIPDCKKAQLLKMEENDQYHYAVTHTPFPIRDRDSYVHYHYKPVPNGIKVEMQALPNYKPKVDKLIRIPYLNGFWLLERQGTNTTKVTYQVHADPGGSIPNWLANATAVNNPYETLKNMREQLENN